MESEFINNAPIYVQIANEIKKEILAGKLTAGERIPSVRDLSLSFTANPNTVQKALSSLEDEGLITTERTNGKFVTTDGKRIEEAKKATLKSSVSEFLLSMKKVGITKAELIKMIENCEIIEEK